MVNMMILPISFRCNLERCFFVASPRSLSSTMLSLSNFSFKVASCTFISSNSFVSIALRFYSFDIFFSCSLILTSFTETFLVEMPMICPISS